MGILKWARNMDRLWPATPWPAQAQGRHRTWQMPRRPLHRLLQGSSPRRSSPVGILCAVACAPGAGGRSTSARPPLPRRRTGPLPGLRDAASPAAATYPGCTPACGTGATSQAMISPSSSRPWQLPRPHTKGPTVVPRSLRRGLQYDPTGAPATVEPLERALDRRLRSCLGVDKPCASSSKRKAPREVRCPARCPTPRQGRAINYMWRPVVLRHGPPATSPASRSAPGHAELQRSAPVPVNPLRFLCAPTL